MNHRGIVDCLLSHHHQIKTYIHKLLIMKIAGLLLGVLVALNAQAQLTQTIRGIVTDEILQKPIEGASVIIAETKTGTVQMPQVISGLIMCLLVK